MGQFNRLVESQKRIGSRFPLAGASGEFFCIPSESSNMFCLNVWITVKDPSHVETVRGLLTELGRLSRAEPGCIRYEVCHSQADATRFLLCERWESQAAWEHHRTLKGFTEIYQPQVLPLVNREPHISTLLE